MFTIKFRYKIIALSAIALGAIACHKEYLNRPQAAIVRVLDKTLSREDIKQIIPQGVSKEDSAEIADKYIDNWVKKTLIAEKAQMNIPQDEPTIAEKVKAYRTSLLISYYEQQLIDQKANIVPTKSEIEDFYQKHQSAYTLNEALIKGIFVKITKDAPELKMLRKWLVSDNPDDFVLLEDYCIRNSSGFDDFRTSWKTNSVILGALPETEREKLDTHSPYKLYELSDSLFIYMLYISESIPQNGIAPVEYVQSEIIKILKQQKKLRFIGTFEREILNDAIQNKQVEYYIEKDAKIKK